MKCTISMLSVGSAQIRKGFSGGGSITPPIGNTNMAQASAG